MRLISPISQERCIPNSGCPFRWAHSPRGMRHSNSSRKWLATRKLYSFLTNSLMRPRKTLRLFRRFKSRSTERSRIRISSSFSQAAIRASWKRRSWEPCLQRRVNWVLVKRIPCSEEERPKSGLRLSDTSMRQKCFLGKPPSNLQRTTLALAEPLTICLSLTNMLRSRKTLRVFFSAKRACFTRSP